MFVGVFVTVGGGFDYGRGDRCVGVREDARS